MPDPSRNWTPAQLAGITTTGQSLLLSAAAGSGKTAVLTERCVYLVCDAPHGCEIDEILVVAFNEAAALEMKGRINQSLQKRLISNPSTRLEKQVALAERAAISTLHGFCNRLLKQHFHRVGLDPNFTVLDADEAALLRQEVAREIFERRYDSDDDGRFQTLIDQYGDGDDDRVVSQVLKIHALLTSVIDPAAWRENSLTRLAAAATRRLPDSALGQEFLAILTADLDLLAGKIAAAIAVISPLKHFDAYLTKLREWRPIVAHWKSLLEQEGLDTFAAEAESIKNVFSERKKAIKADTPGKEIASAAFDEVRDHFKNGFSAAARRFTEAEWRKTVADTLQPAGVLMELVEAFENEYQDRKSQQRAVDFSDLERFALQVLTAEGSPMGAKPSDVARAYHKRFKHVLVDEYQDINEVQDAILRLVSRECVADHAVESNLFCVGDVKQSIYRFRLAEPRRFLERYAAFNSGALLGRVIDLQENFRSRGPLLGALNGVFRRLITTATAEIDYDASHELRPGAPYPPAVDRQFAGQPIELHVVPAQLPKVAGGEQDETSDDLEQDEYEASLVAKRILDLVGRNGAAPRQVMERNGDALSPRDIRLGDIVVLLRSGKFTADHYAETLRRSGIPAHADSRTGFFESQEIRDLLALLQVLDNERQDIPLAAVLRSPIASAARSINCLSVAPALSTREDDPLKRVDRPGLSSNLTTIEDDLATIRLAYNDAKLPVQFHEAVTRYATEKNDALAIKLRQILATLLCWRAMIHQRPVADVIRTIYDDTGLLAYYAGLPDGDQRAANLEELYRRSAQFGTFAKQGLARFLAFLQNLKRDSDLGQPSLDPESADVVRIMTVHQSKGLEFPVVILPNLGRKFNRQDTAGAILADRRSYLALQTVDEPRQVRYPSMATHVVHDTIAAQATAEEIRILYVALTRSREHLILIGSTGTNAWESAQARWANLVGPLPVEAVRGGNSFIDWLLPIAAAEGPGVISVKSHSSEEMLALAAVPGATRVTNDALKQFARLEKFTSFTADAGALGVLDRLRFVYPHGAATTIAAARSVTSWTKHGPGALLLPERVSSDRSPDAGSSLELPRFMALDVKPKATDLGSFTHLVLEHLDFSPQAAPLDAQIAVMVERQLLTEPQVREMSRPAIEWFLQSDLGRRIRANADRLKRELPVYFAAEEFPTTDPADKIMLRGRLDAFLDLPEGGVVIDYKTDRVEGKWLDERAAFYAGQLRAYIEAMTKITGRTVTEAYLVFLTPRKIVTVSSK